MATQRQKVATYAITISCFQQHHHFQRTAHAELFLETLQRYRTKGVFLLHAFAVMPNHVHILITPAIDVATARAIQFVKGGYSYAVRLQCRTEVWHTGFFEHRIRDLADYNAQTLYIAANPERKNQLNYPYVHTQHPNMIDPAPYHFTVRNQPPSF